MPRRRKDAPQTSRRFRDRVRELRRVRAGDLQPHPKNWRLHDERQREAMAAALEEIGWAGASIVRELPDGTLQIVDGHLRAEMAPDEIVPVLVVDLDDVEAEKALATHDAITLLADTDAERLRELSAALENPVLRNALEDLANRPPIAAEAATDVPLDLDEESIAQAAEESPEWSDDERDPNEVEAAPEYSVVVRCDSESHQRELFERLVAEGRDCRLLVL